jgi:hypothetical protein
MFSHLMLIGSGGSSAFMTDPLNFLTSYSLLELALSLHLWKLEVWKAFTNMFFT